MATGMLLLNKALRILPKKEHQQSDKGGLLGCGMRSDMVVSDDLYRVAATHAWCAHVHW